MFPTERIMESSRDRWCRRHPGNKIELWLSRTARNEGKGWHDAPSRLWNSQTNELGGFLAKHVCELLVIAVIETRWTSSSSPCASR